MNDATSALLWQQVRLFHELRRAVFFFVVFIQEYVTGYTFNILMHFRIEPELTSLGESLIKVWGIPGDFFILLFTTKPKLTFPLYRTLPS